MTKLMGLVLYIMLMVMCMRVSGLTIRLMGKGLTLMQTAQLTTESGKMINNTALVLRGGQTEQSMRAIITRVRKTELEN